MERLSGEIGCNICTIQDLLQLGVQESGGDHPHRFLAVVRLLPAPKKGRQCIETQLQAIAGEYGNTAGLQHLAQVMDHRVGQIQSPRPHFQHERPLAGGFDNCPYPPFLASLTHLGSRLIHLDVVQDQVVEEVTVHLASLHPCPSQPGAHRNQL